MSSIANQFVIQFGYKTSDDSDELHWTDESTNSTYVFEPEDDISRNLALKAANTYAAYCDYLESGEEFAMIHRVVHRITSDLVV